MNVAPLDDPGSLSTDPVKRTTALKQVNAYVEANLRQASWSEGGVDIFFVGVNGVVALFCAFLYYFGAVPPLTACASLSLTWIAPIFLLNWLVCWVGYSGYDWMFNRLVSTRAKHHDAKKQTLTLHPPKNLTKQLRGPLWRASHKV